MAGVEAEEKRRILVDFPFAEGSLPVRYLDLPLMTQAMRRQDYMPLVERIRNKISSWTSRYLSYAGRLQLISFVLMSIINFWAGVFRLPSKCMKELEQLCASFLWSGPDLKTSGAKVAWSEICKPKKEGGLGIRSLKEVNSVYGLKLILRLLTGKSMWSNWIHVYLIRGRNFWAMKTKTQAGSWMWRKILKLREIAKQFYKMEIGNGRFISFWYDNWSDKGQLYDLLGDSGVIGLGIRREASLEEAVTRYRRRRYHCSELLSELETVIDSVESKIRNDVDDASTWKGRTGYKAKFSTQETWWNLRGTNQVLTWTNGVWFPMRTPRFAFIAWLAMQNRLFTMDMISVWSQVDVTCVLCKSNNESRDHLFFKCSYSSHLWWYTAGGLLGNSYTDDWSP